MIKQPAMSCQCLKQRKLKILKVLVLVHGALDMVLENGDSDVGDNVMLMILSMSPTSQTYHRHIS